MWGNQKWMQANDKYQTAGSGDFLAMGRRIPREEHIDFRIGSVLIIKLAEVIGVFLFSCFIVCVYVTLFYIYQGFPNLKIKVIIGSIYILFARPLLAVLT